MPTPFHISSPSDPRLGDYNHLTDAQLRGAQSRGEHMHFIAEGEGVVRRLIESHFPIRSILATPHLAEKMADALSLVPASTPLYLVDTAMMEGITGFPFHRGVLASGARLPDLPLADLLATSTALVIAENLSNVDNIGAVFRNTACMLGHTAAIFLTAECCYPLFRKPLRVSMGHALHIPFTSLPNWPLEHQQIKAAGFTTIALTPRDDALDIRSGPLRTIKKPAFLIGAEGPGLIDQTITDADLAVKIPMLDGADSLNVATALAIAVSHWQPLAPGLPNGHFQSSI